MKLVAARSAAERTASDTGVAESCAKRVAAEDDVAKAMSRSGVCMSRIQVVGMIGAFDLLAETRSLPRE